MKTRIGIDIGGTKIAGALVDEQGRIVRRDRRDTDPARVDSIIAATADLVAQLRDDNVLGVGVACAGFIDAAQERVMFAPNIAFRGDPVRELVEQATGLPVVLENDANAAAYGEYQHGSGVGAAAMVMLTLGTGVGGGIVADGVVHRGAMGAAAELGHLRVVPDGQLCGCGNHGCLEAYASGTALVREGRALVRASRPSGAALAQLCGGDPEALTGPMITQAATDGDPGAVALITQIGRWVGAASASLAFVLDPELFVIGGGLAQAGDMLLEPARAAYAEQTPGGPERPHARFVAAALGNDAGVIGAAALVQAPA